MYLSRNDLSTVLTDDDSVSFGKKADRLADRLLHVATCSLQVGWAGESSHRFVMEGFLSRKTILMRSYNYHNLATQHSVHAVQRGELSHHLHACFTRTFTSLEIFSSSLSFCNFRLWFWQRQYCALPLIEGGWW